MTCERIAGPLPANDHHLVNTLAFSQDGSILATGSRSKLFTTGGTARYDSGTFTRPTGRPNPGGHKQPVTAVALTPDGVGLLGEHRWHGLPVARPTGETAGPPYGTAIPSTTSPSAPTTRILVGTGEYPANIMSKSNYGEAACGTPARLSPSARH